jgi:hypothetical protein
MELNGETIEEILRDSRMNVEIVDQPPDTVVRNLTARMRLGQRWSFAFIEQQTPGRSYPDTKKGVLLLRSYSKRNVFEGVYYPQLDCGNDSFASNTTSKILWLINSNIPSEIFATLWVRHCTRFALWNIYSATEAAEIGYNVYEYNQFK